MCGRRSQFGDVAYSLRISGKVYDVTEFLPGKSFEYSMLNPELKACLFI
jgi:hypothetical protein